jgi:prophage regulatory protein
MGIRVRRYPRGIGGTMSTSTPAQLYRLPEVERATGLRRSTLYELIRAGTFPAPVKLARLSAWPSHEVEAWIAARIAERDEGRVA